MRWDAVGRAIAAEAAADPVLAGIYGPWVRMNAGAQDFHVPGLEWSLVTDSASELWEPCIIQWDQWVDDFDDLVISERALRRLFDHALDVEIGGVYTVSSAF